MSDQPVRFSVLQRILHWLIAIMVLAMLFIGVAMVSIVGPAFITLVDIHKPLGVAIFALVLIRLVVRLRRGAPPLPADLSPVQSTAAHLSHLLLYALLVLMPLIGWGMLSAGGYPVVLSSGVQLPSILPHLDWLHADLRRAHTLLAYLLFAVILMHVAAALFHGLIRRDGVLESMASVKRERFG